MRILSVIVLCCSLFLTQSAHADDKSHRAAIVEFFKIADMDSLMKASIDATLEAQIAGNPAIGPFRDTMKQFFGKYMSWASLQEEFVTLYARNFTEAEIKQIVVFYKTPVGKKTLQLMPKLMQEGAEVGMKRVQDHMPELMQMLDQAQKQMKGAK